MIIANSFRVSLVIDWGVSQNFRTRFGCFMINRWSLIHWSKKVSNVVFELVSSLIGVLPMWFIDYSFCVDQHVLINYNFVDALVPDEGRWQSCLNSFKGNYNFVTLFPYMILKTNISLPLPYLDCIKHCWGEQNSTVNSVPADDWTAELAISASKAGGEVICSLDTNQGPFHIVIFSLFFVSKRKK